jgi:coenzyme F420-0:L-glutamate ligase/coenzyme F420-1:gamma-L-glutamate ligase
MTTRSTPVTLTSVTLTPLFGFPEVLEGDDVAEILLTVLQRNEIQLVDGDILVVSSKVVSKAMGLRAPAAEQAEVVLSQSVRIVAERRTPSGVTRIVESAAGPVMTAAGVDASNTADESIILLLPDDPDAVAARILDGLQAGWLAVSGSHVLTGVILSDTAGRPWRNGQTDFALGACGIQVMQDLRGSTDTNGRLLSVTERCVADEIASAADLVKGKADGVPAAHVRGLGQYVRDREVQGHDVKGHDVKGHDIRDQEVKDRATASGARGLVRTGPADWFGYGRVEAVRAALGVEPGSAEASEVGIPFIDPEDATTRATRALRVALLTCPDAIGEVDSDTISLVAPDDFTLGVAATRAEVALRGEGLTTALTRSPGQTMTVDGSLTSHPSVLIAFE